MPWRGLEPRRLSAPPPQDGVSTNFTTRAFPTVLPASPVVGHMKIGIQQRESESDCFHCELSYTGATGLEPATSRVTVECSNQTELRPLTQSGLAWRAYRHRIRSPAPRVTAD